MAVAADLTAAVFSDKTLLPPSLRSPSSSPSETPYLSTPPLPRLNLAAAAGNPISLIFSGDPAGDDEDDRLREECGVVGVYGVPEAAKLCYLALHALQHRGQEGAGIVTFNGGGKPHAHTALGLVGDVFSPAVLASLPGSSAVGHVRYSTAGASANPKNVQPFVAGYRFGSLAVIQNGNLVNYLSLRCRLEDNGSINATTSDTEVVLHLIVAADQAHPFLSRIVAACEQLKGAYSLVFLSEEKLVMGRYPSGAVIFGSETSALDLIEAEYVREVEPG